MNKIDYEDAGLEFVNGDRFSGGTGIPCTVDYFAWRTNTGVKPEFIGKVEYKTRGGIVHVGYSNCVNFAAPYGDELVVIEWRPHLPSIQTETPEEKAALDSLSSKLEDVGAMFDCELKDGVITAKPKSPCDVNADVSDTTKPVYTQAMCDAGELPPVGSRVMIRYAGDTHPKFDEAVIEFVRGGVGVVNINGESVCFDATMESWSTVEFKPIQTEREKFIDGMGDILECHEYSHELGLAFDAGYGLLK